MTEVCKPNTPQFMPQTCTGCIFLGTFTDPTNRVHKEYDLYVCDPWRGDTSVIARYGDEGQEYLSSMIRLVNDNDYPALIAAKNRTFAMMGGPDGT